MVPAATTSPRQGAHFLYGKADLILAIGAGLTRHPLSTPPLPAGIRLIHATNDSRDLHKSYPTELALLGDAKLTLGALIEAVRDRMGSRILNRSPVAEIRDLREAWLAKWEAKRGSSETPITPYRVMAEFMRVVNPAEAIVTHDSGSPREQLLPFYRATARGPTWAGASRTSSAPAWG